MCSKETLLHRYQYVLNLLLIPILFAFVAVSCGDDPVTPAEQIEDAKGTIQGVVVDKATGNALSGVGVTLVYEDSTDDGMQTFSASTESDGSFTLSDVPVSADAKTGDGDNTNPYTLRLDASSLDNYRDSYLAEVDVVFESTEGGDGGVATDLVSNLRLPLSEQAVTVSGKAHTNSDKVISGATVELYQQFNPVINGDNSMQTEMLVATGETGSDGSFTFEGVEEDARVKFKFIDDSDPANVIDQETGYHTTPAGEESASMDLGVVYASEEDRSGAFYITKITPEPRSDVGTDTSFTFTFNRPVADNAWTDASQGFGSGTFKDAIFFEDDGMKKSPGNFEFSVSWNDDRTELTITPENLIDAHEYTLNTQAAFDNNRSGSNVGSPINSGPIANEYGNFVDEYDNDLNWSGASEYSNTEALRLEFSTGDNQNKPHTPTIAVDSTSLNTDWNGGSHNIAWSVNNDPAEVKEYEIFISKNGNPFEHLSTVPERNAQFGELDYGLIGDDSFEYSNSSQAQRIIVDGGSAALDEANSYEVKIRAISTNLQQGEFSDPIAFEDVVKPDVYDVDRGAAGNNNDDKLYVKFTEPLKKGLAEDASNYTINDGNGDAVDATINSIEYAYEDINGPDGTGAYELVITVDDTQDLDDGVELEVSTDVTDLTGNEMRTENDDNIANY